MNAIIETREPSDATTPISREDIRAAHRAPLGPVKGLVAQIGLDETARQRIRLHARELATLARRRAARDGFALTLVHRFGLNTPQGIALMQLAEALPRTTDAETAHALIADKIGALSWRDAMGAASVSQRAALHALDFFAKAFQTTHVGRLQRVARRTLQRAIDVLSRQYVLGETLAHAQSRTRSLARAGYRFSYDMLGEAAVTDSAARDYLQSYLQAVDHLAKQGAPHDAISVKLSALHPRFDERQREHCLPVLLARVKAIAIRARAANRQLTIDAEEADRLELTLDVVEHLMTDPELADWNGLGVAVQAYQRRARAVIAWLDALAEHTGQRINVRLVKGAYWDFEIKRAQQQGVSDYPIFTRKVDTDLSYLACARRLLANPKRFYPQFATHNAHTVAAIVELAEQLGNQEFEFQRLHGMGEHLHAAVLAKGMRSRIYAPIGPRRDLLPYLVRRLLENGASSSFVRQLTDAAIPIEQLVRDPIEQALELAEVAIGKELPRALIPAPIHVRGQIWPAASGFDLGSRDTAAALATYFAIRQEQFTAAPLIGGKAEAVLPPRSAVNPANRSQRIGTVSDATREQVERAVTLAHEAHRKWTNVDALTRSRILERAAELLEARAQTFIRLAVFEAGKTLDDAIGEVREAVDFCRFYAEQCRLPPMQGRDSLGVVACISPWNFPLAIFLGQVTASLAAGNAVIAKPAEQTPLIAMLATQLLHEAGVPVDALALLPGDGAIGATLVGCNAIAAVCFTGSNAAASAIAKTLSTTQRARIPFIAETGGINAMIVDSSALPEQVVRDVLIGAFQSAGQRCSALRILCLQADIADRTLQLLRGALAELRCGDPAQLATDIGPLIDDDAAANVCSYLHTAAAKGSSFVAPTIMECDHVRDVRREVFGPVLHVVHFAATDLMALIDEINSLGYGLTLGVHTRIRQRVNTIVEHARVGNIYVNRHQVGAMVAQQPFGGLGLSGTGPKAGGPHYLLRLSRAASQIAEPCGALQMIEAPSDAAIAHRLAVAHVAQAAWTHRTRYSEQVQFVCEMLSANTLHPLSAMASALQLPGTSDLVRTLPCIAGEDNKLHLRPRGLLLCISTTDSFAPLARQLLLAIACGNAALAVVPTKHAQAMSELLALLNQSGAPDNLIVTLQDAEVRVPAMWLGELGIDGVVFDGKASDGERLAALLAHRPGPLLPLLSGTDEFYRFCIEQTVTINTAAAGGDPHLLGIET